MTPSSYNITMRSEFSQVHKKIRSNVLVSLDMMVSVSGTVGWSSTLSTTAVQTGISVIGLKAFIVLPLTP